MNVPQGPEPDTAGYKGFFYHFLDIDTGRRVWNCELRAINPRHNPTQDTLNRLLRPFKLRVSLAPLTGKTRPNAA
jgi:hypothetical protein